MTRRNSSTPFLVALSVLAALASPQRAHSQQLAEHHPQKTGVAPDTLRLQQLQDYAVQRDPRARQLELLAAQSSLRERNIDATRLPAIGANAQRQYQSQVVTTPIQLPNGTSVPLPPHDTYDASLSAQQPLYDPSVAAHRGVERAQLAASQAAVRSSLFALRQNVNDAYFAALLQQAQVAEQQSAITDLEAHRRVAESRVRQGAALPSEPEMIEAGLLRRRQTASALQANRSASLAVLENLTGVTVNENDALATPDLASAIDFARKNLDTLRARPEYEQFARSRDLLQQQQASLGAAQLPRISAFGRAGYGRPGLNPLAQDFQGYWLAGVKVDWAPWNWGTTRRDRESLALQKQIVETDQAAFRKSVERGVTHEIATIDQLERTTVMDDSIVALRARILHETELRFGEGVITSAEYVDRETDLLDARLARATHRVQLEQARADFLTSLGLETR
jgi:outer membrane protein TolC